MQMPTAYVIALDNVTREVDSARPNAPTVPYHKPARRTRALRLALARGLHRAARAIDPAEPAPAC